MRHPPCRQCHTLFCEVQLSKADIASVAKKLARQDIPSPRLLGQLARYKDELAQHQEYLNDHKRIEHPNGNQE